MKQVLDFKSLFPSADHTPEPDTPPEAQIARFNAPGGCLELVHLAGEDTVTLWLVNAHDIPGSGEEIADFDAHHPNLNQNVLAKIRALRGRSSN